MQHQHIKNTKPKEMAARATQQLRFSVFHRISLPSLEKGLTFKEMSIKIYNLFHFEGKKKKNSS